MGLSVLNQPAAAGGGIKSVQRGSAGGAGNVTITAVDITKSFVTVFGTTSSGTVAASGAISATNMSSSQSFPTSGVSVNVGLYPSGTGLSGSSSQGWCGSNSPSNAGQWNVTRNYTGNSTNLSGGSNNLVAAVVQGYLSNSTTLVVSGACRYEVVEFN